MFKELDCFVLLKSIPNDDTIPVGASGVVLMRFDEPSVAYEVEFTIPEAPYNMGNQLTYTLDESYMGKIDNS
jgi:hypothetical protein